MILSFLRLFAAYRDLEAMLAESQAAYERQAGAYGKLSAATSEIESLEGRLRTKTAEAGSLLDSLLNLEARYKSQEGVIQATEAREARNGMLLCELEEHLAKANARNVDLVDRLEAALRSEIKATQTVTDFIAQLRYGRKIFDHVPELPDMNKELPQPQRKLKPQASDLVHEAERAFWDQINKPKESPAQ